MAYHRILFLALLPVLFLAACSERAIYEKDYDFPEKLWPKDTVASFVFDITETSPSYNIYYTLRNTTSYPNYNFYMAFILCDSSGNPLDSILMNNDLFNSKTGKPYGKGWSDTYDHQFPVLKNHHFTYSGTYQAQLKQYMRYDTLPEIISVGIKIETVK